MMKHLVLVTIGVGALGCTAEVGDQLTASSSEALFGNVLETRTDIWVRATAAVQLPTGNPATQGPGTIGFNCSGTLIAPDRVLTAAHCNCGGPAVLVRFANQNGILDVRDPYWPVIRVVNRPGANVCGEPFSDLTDNDALAHSPLDLAVLVLGPSPQSNGLPVQSFFRPSTFTSDAIPVIPPILSNPEIARDTGRLTPAAYFFPDGIPAPSPPGPEAGPAWFTAGYGENVQGEWTPRACLGCNVRRSGPVFRMKLKDDPCQHFLGIPLERDCWSGNMWVAPSAPQQLPTPLLPIGDPTVALPGGGPGVSFSNGDSGGGLFFKDLTLNRIVVGGVVSNSLDELDSNAQRWAAIGLSGDFMWDALGNPPTLTMVEQRQATAIFARNFARINDRAAVLPASLLQNTARVVAMSIDGGVPGGNTVRVGVDARIQGPLLSRGNIELADRAVVSASVTSERNVFVGNGVQSGPVFRGEFMRFEDSASRFHSRVAAAIEISARRRRCLLAHTVTFRYLPAGA